MTFFPFGDNPPMTRTPRPLLLAFALSLPLFAADAPPKPVFRTEGSSSAEELKAADGTWIGRTTRTRHDFVSAPWAGERAHLLVTSTVTLEERSDREGSTATLVVTALKSGAKPYDTTAWTYRTAAEETAISSWSSFLETTQKGCCGAEDLHRLVDLETGREIAGFSGKYALLESDTRPLERVVSYLSMMAGGDDSAYKAGNDSIGILTLAGREGASDRIVISRAPREDMGTPSVLVLEKGEKEPMDFARLKDAKKGRRAADVVTGVTVVLDWGSGLVARLPVERDGFDLEKAGVPKGFTAAHAKR
jgi:hypothetical protein